MSMIYFNNDYSEGCHEKILNALVDTNMVQTAGYGTDEYCQAAADKIRKACKNDELAVHFLVGGTQANLTVIDAALRPHQAVLGAVSAHINAHETGAVEATGHKVLSVPSDDGKITAQQVEAVITAHLADESMEHTVQPKMVYLSNSTELGTIYFKKELEEISAVCHRYGMYLFLDGARLGYALTAQGNDLTLADIAKLCDVFYIGGTKVGALFGEAVVISSPEIAADFRYLIKQHGGMLAKGRLLGIQFDVLFEDDLYFTIARNANVLAHELRTCLSDLGYPMLVPGVTNQIFPILPNSLLEQLRRNFSYTDRGAVDEGHRAVRFCTSWATKPQNVAALCAELRRLSK